MNNQFFIPTMALESDSTDSQFSEIAKLMVNQSQGVSEMNTALIGQEVGGKTQQGVGFVTLPTSLTKNGFIPDSKSDFGLNQSHDPNHHLQADVSIPSTFEQMEHEARLGEIDRANLSGNYSNKASPWKFTSWIPVAEKTIESHVSLLKNDGMFDVKSIRKDFPILSNMIWFDNAATTQKPSVVMEAMDKFLREENSNIHRGAHQYAKHATDLYEEARKTVAKFIHAKDEKEIIFVRGCTEGINLVAHSFGENFIQQGDEIIISYLEHHSNLLPWQTLARKKGARLRVIPIDKNGNIIVDEYARLLSSKTKMVALTQVANSIGTVLPVGMMTKMAKAFGAHVLIDAAQSIPHFDINVQDLECDFLIFSGHKIYGPTGIGVVYGKETLLNLMQPYQTGGGMIEDVNFDYATYAPANAKFEAGTPNVVGAVGLKAALDYIQRIGLSNIADYEKILTDYALNAFSKISNLQLIGMPKDRVSVVSFVLEGVSKEVLANNLDASKIALRMGHHCAIPTVRFFGHESTIRPSFALYNTKEEIDLLIDVIRGVR